MSERLCTLGDEDCRTAVFGKTERTVGWEGNGELAMMTLVRHCNGKPAATDRPNLLSLSHSFTLDFVCAFEAQEDAERFFGELNQRLRKFGLELSTEKTRVIAFSRYLEESASFEFLGFEFRWGQDRKGRPQVRRRTARKKLRNSIKQLGEWCKKNRHVKVREQFKRLNAKLRGYYNYYGVHGNEASLNRLFTQTIGYHLKWLNRRGERQSYTWAGYKEAMRHFKMELPRIVGRPKMRMRRA